MWSVGTLVVSPFARVPHTSISGVFKTRNGEILLKIGGKVIKYYCSSTSCNCCPINFILFGDRAFNYCVQGERGGGVDTFFSAEKKKIIIRGIHISSFFK